MRISVCLPDAKQEEPLPPAGELGCLCEAWLSYCSEKAEFRESARNSSGPTRGKLCC